MAAAAASWAPRWYPRGVKRVLLTGMSGTGKSTLIEALAARGYKAVDLDTDEWSEWVDVPGDPDPVRPGQDWVWREDRVRRLLATEDEDAAVLFVSGCASNQGKFRARFGHVIDYVDVGIGSSRFYAFNVADAAISIGILLLIVAALLGDRVTTRRSTGSSPAPGRAP